MVKTEPLIIFIIKSSRKFLNLELPSEFVNLFSGPKIKNGNVYFMLSSISTSFLDALASLDSKLSVSLSLMFFG